MLTTSRSPLSVASLYHSFLWVYIRPTWISGLRVGALSRYYGIFTSIMLNHMVSDVWAMEAEILCCGSHMHTDFARKAQLDELNMTAVAGAIVASVTVTAFALPDIVETHWIARALWSSSLVTSLLCVYCASSLQRKVGRLLRPEDLLEFIRVKKDVVLGKTCHPKRHTAWPLRSKTWSTRTGLQNDEFDDFGYTYLPSASSILLLSCPRFALAYSVNSFIAGLGVYLGTLWVGDLMEGQKTSKSDARNIFVFFAVTAAVCYLVYAQLMVTHSSQEDPLDVRDKIISGLEHMRQSTLDAVNCKDEIEFSAWRAREHASRQKPGRKVSMMHPVSPPHTRDNSREYSRERNVERREVRHEITAYKVGSLVLPQIPPIPVEKGATAGSLEVPRVSTQFADRGLALGSQTANCIPSQSAERNTSANLASLLQTAAAMAREQAVLQEAIARRLLEATHTEPAIAVITSTEDEKPEGLPGGH